MATTDIDPCLSTTTLQNQSFARDENGDIVRRVVDTNADASNPLSGINWDAFTVTDNSLTDVVEYYAGGTGGTLLATFTATYTSPRKKTLVSGVWTYP